MKKPYSFDLFFNYFRKKDEFDPPHTVPYVNFDKYYGKWYEIASIPLSYTEGSVGTTATFEPMKKKKILLTIRYHQDHLSGPLTERRGKGWIIDKTTNAKLKVQFIWPFTTQMWILELDSKYQYSVIGSPGRDSLWIIDRNPVMEEGLYEQILEKLKAAHYDITKIKKTIQPTD